MVGAENATSVTLKRGEGGADTVLRGEIDDIQSTGVSIMPDGLENSIDLPAMADLLAYLMQAK